MSMTIHGLPDGTITLQPGQSIPVALPKKHNYTLRAKEGKWEVVISPTTDYGYFEHDIHGEGGGLWFEKKRLIDADGTFEVPKDVIKALRSLGYVVPREF